MSENLVPDYVAIREIQKRKWFRKYTYFEWDYSVNSYSQLKGISNSLEQAKTDALVCWKMYCELKAIERSKLHLFRVSDLVASKSSNAYSATTETETL